MISWVGSTCFSSVSAWDSLLRSYFSIPALNLMCSISCWIASGEGSEFFSAVSALRRLPRSNLPSCSRLSDRASSVCIMAAAVAGSLVRTDRRDSFSNASTPLRRPWCVFFRLYLFLARQHKLLLGLGGFEDIWFELRDAVDDCTVSLLSFHILGRGQTNLLC